MRRIALTAREWLRETDWLIVGIALVASAVVVTWVAWALHSSRIMTLVNTWADLTEAGQWGDSFGGLNALFGALGFSAIVATLFLQGRALARQQRDQFHQRFDQSFFQLLTMLREARDEVRFRPSSALVASGEFSTDRLRYGHAAFRAAFIEAKFWMARASEQRRKDRGRLATLYFRRVHARYESTFGAYYRMLYAILDRVREADQLTEDEKNRYGNMVRAQFTSYEAGLAGLNALMKVSKDFDSIVIRFRLLKYLRAGGVKTALGYHFPREAFLGRDSAETDRVDG